MFTTYSRKSMLQFSSSLDLVAKFEEKIKWVYGKGMIHILRFYKYQFHVDDKSLFQWK